MTKQMNMPLYLDLGSSGGISCISGDLLGKLDGALDCDILEKRKHTYKPYSITNCELRQVLSRYIEYKSSHIHVLVPEIFNLDILTYYLPIQMVLEFRNKFTIVFYETILESYQRVYEIAEPELPIHVATSITYWRCDIQGAPSGKLYGKTIAVKDDIMLAGVPMMNGSKILEGYIPDADATIVTRVLDAGGRILGKSVCLDHCFGGDSFNCATGPVPNPYDKTRDAGGSSTGSAVLVARGEVDMALGEDAAGSIRVPAAWCGIVAMKPTFGLVPYTGIVPFEITLDHAGPMTRTVYDCALLLEVLAGYDDVSGKRIGILQEGFQDADAEVKSHVLEAVEKLRPTGVIIENVSIPMHNDAWHIFLPIDIEGSYSCMIQGNEYGRSGYHPSTLQEALARGRAIRPFDLLTNVKMASIFGEYVQQNYQQKFYGKAQNIRGKLIAAYEAVFKDFDVIIMPTTRLRRSLGSFKNTAPFDATGHPALTINTGFSSDDLPIGMMIVGRMHEEKTVLQIARSYEKIRDSGE
ncbi:hypothetical protein KUTeg_004133 [Tegillarca granosa]|uniref:Amidase domain-containing protein n=1 Tax=Tegillarca granosa TaxID=220873 RepID=A0ABQ9FP34_TEGGR|nr:hypothetical protein KUTeg_004133 [Tegillarca granosa]